MSRRTVLDLEQPILVTMESFAHFKDANLCSDDGSIFECTLINCDQVSRNKTYYPLDDVLMSMKDRRVQEKIDNKCFFGEAEHPSSDTDEPVPLKRLMRVEPTRWCWRIDSYRTTGSDIRGTIQWAGPLGATYQKEFLNGTNYAASIRAYTPNYLKKSDGPNGDYVVKKHLMFIASYDCVLVPGLGGARIMDPDKYAALSKNDVLNIRNVGNTIVKSTESFREITFKDPISEIRDIMHSEEGANVIRDIFGIDFATAEMAIRGKNSLSVRTTEGSELILPLSRTLLSEIL